MGANGGRVGAVDKILIMNQIEILILMMNKYKHRLLLLNISFMFWLNFLYHTERYIVFKFYNINIF